MADIEDRAETWARDYAMDNELPDTYDRWEESLHAAYMAGVRQTQRDYTTPFNLGQGHETERGGM